MSEQVAVVRSLWPETEKLRGMTLSVDPELAAAHRLPGQYLVLKYGEQSPVILAIASTPGDPSPFEVLLGADAQARLPSEPGATIAVGHPQGPGFPIEKAKGLDVHVFAVGTGLSAIRPLLARITASRGEFGRVALLMGAKSWAEHPYLRLDDQWREAGIDVRRSVGRPWVQELFLRDRLPLDRAFVFVCGMREMVDDVKRRMIGAGLPPERIGVNW